MTQTKKLIRACISGPGARAAKIANALRQIDEEKLPFHFGITGVYSPREETARGFARKHAPMADAYHGENGYQEMLGGNNTDLVIITSPNPYHAAQVEAAFEQTDAAIYCDKPLAASREDLARLKQLEASHSRVLQPGLPFKLDPVNIGVMEMLKKWEFSVGMPIGADHGYVNQFNFSGWKGTDAIVNPVSMAGIHALNLQISMMEQFGLDRPEVISSEILGRSENGIATGVQSVICYQSGNGETATGRFIVSLEAAESAGKLGVAWGLEWAGFKLKWNRRINDGNILWSDGLNTCLHPMPIETVMEHVPPEMRMLIHPDPAAREFIHLGYAILEGKQKPPAATFREALESESLGFEIMEMALNGKPA